MRGSPPPESFDEPLLSKATTHVAVVMSSVGVLGFFAVSIMLRLHGYGHDEEYGWPPGKLQWNPLATFIRHHGFQLLWVPVVWTVVAAVAQKRDRGNFYACTFWIGVLITAAMTIAFGFAATHVEPRMIR